METRAPWSGEEIAALRAAPAQAAAEWLRRTEGERAQLLLAAQETP